jgi:hypothetical protein
VGGAVDQPRDVVRHDDPHEDPPDQPRPPADREQDEAEPDGPPQVRLLKELVEAAVGEIGREPQLLGMREHRLVRAIQPLHVAPEQPAVDVVRIAFFIGVRMMRAMRRDPIDRTALEREDAEDRDHVFDRLRDLQAAVCEEAVVTERDSPRARNVIQHDEHDERAPMECPGDEGAERAEVDDPESYAGSPTRGTTLRVRGFHRPRVLRPRAARSWRRERPTR